MLNVGLTGNIASGKSTVAHMLAEHGATVVDSDLLAREAVEPGTVALRAIRHRFGDEILTLSGTLNRSALGRLVFRDAVARRDLNAIVHPEVARLRELQLEHARAHGARIVVSDVPLLFEVRLEESFDAVVLVDAPEAMRLERLVARRDLPEADARAMMSAQWPAAEKRALATFIVDNEGSVEQLRQRVNALWQQLERLAANAGRVT
jgi:dephospho-CoA kinase